MKIGVTGSSGFIGSTLVPYLEKAGHSVVAIPRDLSIDFHGLDVIVHLAAIADRNASSVEINEANHIFTTQVADRAVEAVVSRFVFLSSIFVVAGNSGILTPDMPRKPIGAYGGAKAKAEEYLLSLSGLDATILRAPLIYGVGAKGNVALLRRTALSNLPLPFGSVKNRRTMISISNLISAIEHVATRSVTQDIYHVTDLRPLSLAEIITTIRKGAGRKPALISIPPALMRTPLRMLGKGSLAEQLFGDMIVDGSALVDEGWRVPFDPTHDLLLMGAA